VREQYGVLFPRFWEGTTGRQLQEKGRDAVILAAYLASCRHANMIGLYELPLVFLERELSVLRSRAHILKAFHALQEVSYATYDMGTEHVWVREMARIRLGLEPAETINQGDNKHKAVVKLYVSAKSNPFLAPFFDRYHATLRLADGRIGPPLQQVIHSLQGTQKGLSSGSKGARKPVQVQVHQSVQVQGSGTQKHQQEKAAAAPPLASVEHENPDANVEVITAIVAKDLIPLGVPEDDLIEATKSRCATMHVAYDSSTVRKAVDSALFRAGLRRRQETA